MTSVIYTDGACKNNHVHVRNGAGHLVRPMDVAWVHGLEIRTQRVQHPNPTNNVAEFLAAIYALEWAFGRGMREVTIRADSQLLVNCMTGKARLSQVHLINLRSQIVNLISSFEQVDWEWVPRDSNLAGHVLEDK